MMMLNLILNGMAESLTHVIKGNTMTHPFHKDDNGKLKQFDFVVSNPPFKLDFSDQILAYLLFCSRFWCKPEEGDDKLQIVKCGSEVIVGET